MVRAGWSLAYLLGSVATAHVPADVSLLVVRTRYAPIRDTAFEVNEGSSLLLLYGYLPQQFTAAVCIRLLAADTAAVGGLFLGLAGPNNRDSRIRSRNIRDSAYVRIAATNRERGATHTLLTKIPCGVCSVRGCGYVRPCVVVRGGSWLSFSCGECRRAPARDIEAIWVYI